MQYRWINKRCTPALLKLFTGNAFVRLLGNEHLQIKLPWSHLPLCRHVNVSLSSDDGGDACSLAKSRSRREKREKVGRKSALEQLKKAKKGEKIRYEVRNTTVFVMSIFA